MAKILWHGWGTGTDAASLCLAATVDLLSSNTWLLLRVGDLNKALLYMGLLQSGGPEPSVPDYIILPPWQPPLVEVVVNDLPASKVQYMNQEIQQHMLRAVTQTSILDSMLYHTDGSVDPARRLAAVTDREMHGEHLTIIPPCIQELMVIQHTLDHPQNWQEDAEAIHMDFRSTLQAL